MRSQVYIRPYNPKRPGEKQMMLDWLYANRAANRFDPELFIREQVKIFTLWDEDNGVIGFIPVAMAFLVESLAFKPGIDEMLEARALQTFQGWLVTKAAEGNVPDAVFVTTDERVIKFAEKHKWHEPTVKQLRLHFSHLEKPNESQNQSGS